MEDKGLKIPGGKGRLFKRTKLLAGWTVGNAGWECEEEIIVECNFFFLLHLSLSLLLSPVPIFWVDLVDLLEGWHLQIPEGSSHTHPDARALSHRGPNIRQRALLISHCENSSHLGVSFLPSAIYWWKWKCHIPPPGRSNLQILNRLESESSFVSYLFVMWNTFFQRKKLQMMAQSSCNKHLLNE